MNSYVIKLDGQDYGSDTDYYERYTSIIRSTSLVHWSVTDTRRLLWRA